jgi:Mrp family chromosome partitioning ATPase
MDKLKEMYDYLIIDSAPAGILTETFVLMKYSDLNIVVVRLNKTLKEALKRTLRSIGNNKFQNISIIVNDIYANRESYKYGYDKKYYTDDKQNNFLNRIFRFRRKAS